MSTQQELTISPARKTRQQEKEELAGLNNRFASYIEQVRSLKELNLNYEHELKVLKEQRGQELERIKALYEKELSSARELLDETAKEKARQQILASKTLGNNKELNAEIKELRESREALMKQASDAERAVAAMDIQRKAAVAERTALQNEMKDKDAEIQELHADITELRSVLERESLCKVEFQNNLLSLNEELSFRKKVHVEELQAMRENFTHTRTYDQVDTSLDAGQLETIIDELREKSDMDIAGFKEMLEAAYKDKITKLEDMASRDSTTITQLDMELRKFNDTLASSKAENTKLQEELERLEALLDTKDAEISRMTQKHASDMAVMREERRALQESYDAQIEEYRVLMDLKVQLDQEIATYRALLQQEENRLNLTPTPRRAKRCRSQATTSELAFKRPRFDTPVQQSPSVSSSSSGCIQICEVDSTGRFVQIKNMSTAVEFVGGLKIVHHLKGQEEIAFRFHQKSKLLAGASVRVWGLEAEGAVHNPPHDIIWKKQASWGAGTDAVTNLVSASGEVLATFRSQSQSRQGDQEDLENCILS